MLPYRENFEILVPEWLKISAVHLCTCSHVIAMLVKGPLMGTFFSVQSDAAVETDENTEFAVGSFLIRFVVRNSQQRIVACRHFLALVSLLQGCIACRNLPLTGPSKYDI